MSAPSTNQLCQWVEAIQTRGINLDSWEIDFIENMQIKIDRYGDRASFTDNMAEKIEEIYSARVP